MAKYIKSSSALTIVDDGNVVMFPRGTIEYELIKHKNANELDDFPFVRSFVIKADGNKKLTYDVNTRAVLLNGGRLPASIAFDLKVAIYYKTEAVIENFFENFKNLNTFVQAFVFDEAKCGENFLANVNIDGTFMLNLKENDIIAEFNNGFVPSGCKTDIEFDTICKVTPDGYINFVESALSDRDFNFCEEYNTAFPIWLKYLNSEQKASDMDAFFDELNRKLHLVYNYKSFLLEMHELSPLSKILTMVLKKDDDDENEDEEVLEKF